MKQQQGQTGSTAPATYDLVIKGGRVLDPASGTDATLDVAVSGDRIAKVEKDIDLSRVARIVDAAGKLVTPGLIDIHTHVAAGLRKAVAEDIMLAPDVAGVTSGITTLLDAGSTGAYNVGGFVNFNATHAKTRVRAFLNVGSLGLICAPEVRTMADIDRDASVAAIRAHAEVICGVKLRMVSPAIAELAMDLIDAAKDVALEAGVPMMVHMGDIMGDHPTAGELAPRLLSEVLTAGDIVTHTFGFRVGALLCGDDLLPQAWEARDRGVIFDVGVGRANFSFDSAQKVLDQGFVPDTISSDLTATSRFAGPTYSLAECMGKVMSLGLSLEDAVRMTTSKAAETLGLLDDIGSLAAGKAADISILEVAEGEWVFHDVTGQTNVGSLAIRPVACVRAGEMIPIDYGPHPWGWLPESAPSRDR